MKNGFITGCMILLFGCQNPKDVSIVMNCDSPDKKQIATFFIRSGGGAAGYQYEYLNLREATEPFDYRNYVLALNGGYEVRIEWHGPEVVVYYPNTARVDKMVKASGSKDIRYVAAESKNGLFDGLEEGCFEGKR